LLEPLRFAVESTDADIDDVIWNLVLCRTRLPCEREPLLGILIVPGGGGEWIS
jgi:hypothetical protein